MQEIYQDLYDNTNYGKAIKNRCPAVRSIDKYKDWLIDNIIDLGCGSGDTVKKIRGLGFVADGVDYITYDNDMIVGDITKETDLSEYNSCICVDVFEHIQDKGIKQILKNIQGLKHQVISINNKSSINNSSIIESNTELHINIKSFKEWENIISQYINIKSIIEISSYSRIYLCEKKVNECFLEFKDKHKGEKGILFGTGPTLDEFDKHHEKFKDYVLFGSNEIIYKPYKMDYYFMGDSGDKKRGYQSDPDSYNNYKPNIAKFYKDKSSNVHMCHMPKGLDAFYYKVTSQPQRGGRFYKDIAEGLGAYASISTTIMQFVLYTGVREVYLVGHDCNYSNGSFHDKNVSQGNKCLLGAWRILKSFINNEYPEVEVYSVNPVSLKIFKRKDIYDI